VRLSCLDERGLTICRPHRAGHTMVLIAEDVDGWNCGRGGRGRQQLVAADCGDRRDDE
jgi:hypothetical protein